MKAYLLKDSSNKPYCSIDLHSSDDVVFFRDIIFNNFINLSDKLTPSEFGDDEIGLLKTIVKLNDIIIEMQKHESYQEVSNG